MSPPCPSALVSLPSLGAQDCRMLLARPEAVAGGDLPLAGLLAPAGTNSQNARVGRHILYSCRPITLGVTHEQQLREMKAGKGLAWLYSQGTGFVRQLWLATGLVWGMWSGHRLLRHLLLSSSVSAGGCNMWGLLVASAGLAGLVLDLWEVQLSYCHFSLPGSAA